MIATPTARRHRRRTGIAHRFRTRGQRSGRRGVSIAINLAPMIDVTFLLLIFFLVTTTFERAEGVLTSEMPGNTAAASVSLPLTPIVVRLTPRDADAERVDIRIDRIGTAPGDFEGLVNILRELQGKPGFDVDTPVVIIAVSDVKWDHVVGAWNAVLRAGCTRVAFGEP